MGPQWTTADVPDDVLHLVSKVCSIAASRTLIDDARVELAAAGVIEAVRKRDTGIIFDWLMDRVSYQGVSDAAAYRFIEEHERITAADIEKQLRAKPRCPRLRGYHTFHDCGFRKWKGTCAEPLHQPDCPLPRHDLRNGRLNRTAYSLYLFMRDVCMGDFVGWVDYQLGSGNLHDTIPGGISTGPVIGPMSFVEGIGPKVLSMAMANFLLAVDVERKTWIEAGARMIAVDSLVHNWMHRTGILHRLKAAHPYGEGCYKPGGCSQIIEQCSSLIDARTFNRDYPRDFPRMVQHALWRFCAQDELSTCNGIRIKDTERCKQKACELYPRCGRRKLHLN